MLRKTTGLILSICISVILLGTETTHAQQKRSVTERLRYEQQRRNAQIAEQTRRWRQQYEQWQREWKLREERRRRGNAQSIKIDKLSKEVRHLGETHEDYAFLPAGGSDAIFFTGLLISHTSYCFHLECTDLALA
jgi:hypothetical protein